DDSVVVLSNGAVAGDMVHGVPANMAVTGALAFQSNQLVAATQAASQVFQIGSLPLFQTLLNGNSSEQFVDRLFLALSRGTDVATDLDSLTTMPTNFWDSVVQDWMVVPTQPASLEMQFEDAAAGAVNSQGTQEHAGAERVAVVDQVF